MLLMPAAKPWFMPLSLADSVSSVVAGVKESPAPTAAMTSAPKMKARVSKRPMARTATIDTVNPIRKGASLPARSE